MKKTIKIRNKVAGVVLGVGLLLGLAYGLMAYARCSVPFLACRLLFNYYLSQDAKEIDREAHSGLSSTYYFTSYYLNGILSAAEGTGSDAVLRKALGPIDIMLSTAEDFEDRGRHYKAWRPFAVTPDSLVAGPNLHFTFQSMVPVARAAAIIMTHPEFKRRYASTAQRYIDFAQQSVIAYWYQNKLKGDIPWIHPEHFPIWNDNGSNLALITIFLYEATKDPLYYDMSHQIGTAFQFKLVPMEQGWIWEPQTITIGSDTDNTPGSVGNQAGVPDTSHANREAMLIISLYESGILFNRDDVERMAHTFTDTLWNQSTDSPMFSNYIDGSDKPYRVYKEPGLNGSIYHGWALLGGYSPKAQYILLKTLEAIVRGRMNAALERNTSSYGGRLSLCGHILRNFSVEWTRESGGVNPSVYARFQQTSLWKSWHPAILDHSIHGTPTPK